MDKRETGYLNAPTKLNTFSKKPRDIQLLIEEALHMIESFGVPLQNMTDRRLERMALAFLAVADVKSHGDWKKTKDINDHRSMKTRDIISYWNEFFYENISKGSYDDIRRKDLLYLVLAGIIVNTMPNSATNNPSRGYALSHEYATIIREYGSINWMNKMEHFRSNIITLSDKMEQKRNLNRIKIVVPNGSVLEFSMGKHNELQKAVIEDFLPLFGFEAELLYVGDTAKKHIINEEDRLKELGFFELDHGELPDIIAYSKTKNWLYIIEAVNRCNPITITRKIKIEELAQQCTADIIFISAFSDKKTFLEFAADIAWETEVWVASNPEHMIHFNGDKFLGSYKSTK